MRRNVEQMGWVDDGAVGSMLVQRLVVGWLIWSSGSENKEAWFDVASLVQEAGLLYWSIRSWLLVQVGLK